MSGINVQDIAVSEYIVLHVYYNRQDRTWWGFYTDRETGYQLGDAWSGMTRDEVLVFRPAPVTA